DLMETKPESPRAAAASCRLRPPRNTLRCGFSRVVRWSVTLRARFFLLAAQLATYNETRTERRVPPCAASCGLNPRAVCNNLPRMKTWVSLLAIAVAALAMPSRGETVKDREGAVRKDRSALEYDGRWIYNDFRVGFAKAKQTGKPLLVVLRCVPCLSCAGIDA